MRQEEYNEMDELYKDLTILISNFLNNNKSGNVYGMVGRNYLARVALKSLLKALKGKDNNNGNDKDWINKHLNRFN